jgi:hypothetical protein
MAGAVDTSLGGSMGDAPKPGPNANPTPRIRLGTVEAGNALNAQQRARG